MSVLHTEEKSDCFICISDKLVNNTVNKYRQNITDLQVLATKLELSTNHGNFHFNYTYAMIGMPFFGKHTKTFPLAKVKEIIKDMNSKKFTKINDLAGTFSFLYSFQQNKWKTIFFCRDTLDLNFLFDNSKKPSVKNLEFKMESKAINELFALTVATFYHLGTQFEKIQINSGYRTHEEQAGIIMKLSNLDAYGVTKYFITYLRSIEQQDEGIYKKYYEDYKIHGKFDTRIKNNSQLIIDVQTRGVLAVLIEYMKAEIYKPSKHTFGKAYDLKKNIATKYIYNNHKYGKSDKYNTHYHISMNW